MFTRFIVKIDKFIFVLTKGVFGLFGIVLISFIFAFIFSFFSYTLSIISIAPAILIVLMNFLRIFDKE